MTKTRPQPDGTPRRPPRTLPRWRRLLALAVLAPWAVLLAAWLVGRLIGDRTLWTQYLEWIPTEAVALAGLVTALLHRLVRGRRAGPTRAVLAATVAVVLWLVAAEWSLWRAVSPKPAPTDAVRVVFMNISLAVRPADISPVFNAGGDIVVLSNVHPQPKSFEKIYGYPPVELLPRAIGITPGESPPGDIHALHFGTFRVLSRHPVRRRASASVGSQETWIEDDKLGTGAVLMLEFDTPHGPLVLWAVDMPRTLGASRRGLFEQVAARIDGVENVLEADALGRWILAERRENDPLFSPDVIVGDFNTPGHAWSVRRFMPHSRPARADAGIGPAGTWPAEIPLFEIDLARLGPGVRAVLAERIEAHGCRHLGLVLDIEPDSPPESARTIRPEPAQLPGELPGEPLPEEPADP